MAFGFGYQVKAGIDFQSNGVAEMKRLAAAVSAAADGIDAQTKAIMAQAKATRAMAAEIRASVAAISGQTQAVRSNAAAFDTGTAAIERYTRALTTAASAQRMLTGGFGTPRGQAWAAGAGGVIPPGRMLPGGKDWVYPGYVDAQFTTKGATIPAQGMPFTPGPASRALGGGPGGQRALPPWRDGPPPANFGGTGLAGQPGGWSGRAFGMGGGGGGGFPPGFNPFGGVGPGPSSGGYIPLPNVGGIARGAVNMLNPMHHFVEAVGAIDAVHEAAHFQGQLQSIYNILGVTSGSKSDERTRTRLRQEMFDTGDQYAMSPIQSADMFREIARQSQGAMPTASMEQMLPYIARMQVVLRQTRGMGAQETTDAAMNFVHLLRLYKPEQMGGEHGGFDLMTRLMEMSPVSPAQLVRQMTYVAPDFLNLGIPNEQLAALMLTLTRSGYGTGKGATGIAALVRQGLGPAQITSFSTAIKQGYLKEMGVLDKDGKPAWGGADGKGGDVLKMLAMLGHYEQGQIGKLGTFQGKAQSEKIFASVFGVQGSRMANLLSDPSIVKVLEGSIKTMTGQSSLGLTEQSNKYLNLTTTRIDRAWQNFQALMTELGWVTLPAVSKAFNDLGNELHAAQAWLNSHRALTKQWSDSMVSAVKTVEEFLVAHKTDIVETAKDIATIAGALLKLGVAVAKLDGGPLLGLIRVLADVASGHYADALKVLGPKNPGDQNYVDYLDPYGTNPVGPRTGKPGGGWGKTPWNAVAPSRKADGSIGTVQIIIQGAGKNAKEIADLVDARMKALMSNPRSFQSGGADSRTHRKLPKSLSVATG